MYNQRSGKCKTFKFLLVLYLEHSYLSGKKYVKYKSSKFLTKTYFWCQQPYVPLDYIRKQKDLENSLAVQ